MSYHERPRGARGRGRALGAHRGHHSPPTLEGAEHSGDREEPQRRYRNRYNRNRGSDSGDRPPPGFEGRTHPQAAAGGQRFDENTTLGSMSLNPGAASFHPRQTQPVPTRRRGRPSSASSSREGRQTAPRPTSAAEPLSAEASPDYPSCVVCCDTLKAAAVGACNHKDICAPCSLRMRMCYGSTSCPLCKADLKEVVMTPWRPGGVPDWKDLQQDLGGMWTNLSWMRNVFVDNRHVAGLPKRKQPLSSELEALTGKTCCICDKQGARPYPSHRSLMRHMEVEHHKYLCKVCLMAERQFPSELPPMDGARLRRHMEVHPQCEFCSAHFFGHDELFDHMRFQHFCCYVCAGLGRHVYFPSAMDLLDHLGDEHYRCLEDECREYFIAFATPLQLELHNQEVHGRHRRGRGGRRLVASTGPRSQTLRQNGNDSAPARRGSRPDVEQGLRLIDDDLGLQDQWTGESWQPSVEDPLAQAFPSLESATVPLDSGSESAGEPAAPRLPQLVSVARRCPCGRRSDRPVVPEGEDPGPLECDGACLREQRRRQLAAAFDIPDPDRHQPVMERHEAEYTPQTLLYARANRAFVEDVERQVLSFFEGRAPRHVFEPMRREQRRVTHEVGAAFRMATQSVGDEPQRHVRLFRNSQAGIPRNMLSRQAAAMTQQEIDEASAGPPRHRLFLTDVSPGLDLGRVFSQWQGQFSVEEDPRRAAAALVFETPEALQEALQVMGGGRRGAFLVDRKATQASQRQPGGANEQGRGTLSRPQLPRQQGSDSEDAWQPVSRKGRSHHTAPNRGNAKSDQEAESSLATGFAALEDASEEENGGP